MTEGMKKQAQFLIDQAYQKGYKTGTEDADVTMFSQKSKLIEQGRNEAWEAMRTIVGLGEPLDVCGAAGFRNFVCGVSASEAIEKLHKYEEKKKQEENEIHVGDEVVINENAISSFKPNTKAIVIMIDGCSDYSYNVIIANGDTDWVGKDEIRKTGRTFPEIVEVLKKLKEDK